MKKNSVVVKNGNKIFKQPALPIGLDLGDRSSYYCILDEMGYVILERNVPTTRNGIRQAFGKIPRCRIALETGAHSPWVTRQLARMDHEVIVAHARNVRLICERSRKDDQLDARTLARLARIDPGLLGPVRHRSAKAQIQLTVIRARAALVRAPSLGPERPQNSVEWYFLMQHCGAPTRLLDWTGSALIALFFSVKGKAAECNTDAAVWILEPWKLNEIVANIGEVIAPGAEAGMVAKHAERYKPWLPDRYSNAKRLRKRFPVAIYPTHFSRRISAQRSCLQCTEAI